MRSTRARHLQIAGGGSKGRPPSGLPPAAEHTPACSNSRLHAAFWPCFRLLLRTRDDHPAAIGNPCGRTPDQATSSSRAGAPHRDRRTRQRRADPRFVRASGNEASSCSLSATATSKRRHPLLKAAEKINIQNQCTDNQQKILSCLTPSPPVTSAELVDFPGQKRRGELAQPGSRTDQPFVVQSPFPSRSRRPLEIAHPAFPVSPSSCLASTRARS